MTEARILNALGFNLLLKHSLEKNAYCMHYTDHSQIFLTAQSVPRTVHHNKISICSSSIKMFSPQFTKKNFTKACNFFDFPVSIIFCSKNYRFETKNRDLIRFYYEGGGGVNSLNTHQT